MPSRYLKFLMLGLLSGHLFVAQAADKKEAAQPSVKKSEAGICHDASSPSFNATKKFTAFTSMDECIKSGGRAPAGQATPEAVVKKSESGICHDKNSASYAQTKKFTEFKTVDECVKSGGTLPKK